MTIEDPTVVDFVGVENSTGTVTLTISDHLSWKNVEHFELLEKKSRIISHLFNLEASLKSIQNQNQDCSKSV